MKIKRRAYALTEMLVIIVMIIVLMGLSVRPMRTLVSEIPHSARVCQTLNRSMKALDQLRNDIERSNRIAGLAGGVLTLEQPGGMVRYTLSYGHIGADLLTLAAMLRIPVCMHNVPEEQVYRPSAWTAFGAQDPMGADFRACANFGPLYG